MTTAQPNIQANAQPNTQPNIQFRAEQLAQLDSLPKSKLTGKPVLHFVHANGVPSPTYLPILERLEKHFTIERIDKLGTHPNYPVDNHWQSLTRQVGDSIDDACYKHGVPTVVAVGHSVGAMTTMQTLLANPKPISQAVLLDPSLLTGKNSLLWHLAKTADSKLNRIPALANRMIDKLSPAGKSKYRKDTFNSYDDAYQALRDKPLFRPFDERCFGLYIQHGFVPTADGKVTLTIPKAVEVAIFRTIPSLYWYKSISPKRPLTIIAGKDSHFTRIGSYKDAEHKFGLTVHYVDGEHMFPLERPDAISDEILATILRQL